MSYVSHEPYMQRIWEVSKLYKDGVISKQECEMRHAAILEEFDEACKAANKSRYKSA